MGKTKSRNLKRRDLKLAVIILFTLAASAGELTMTEGVDSEFVIQHCHPGDVAVIRDKNGMTITTNAVLRLNDFSMLQNGTNLLTIQTVCSGMTSAPASLVMIIKRTPPAPIVKHRRANLAPTPEPPIPGGMKMTLPNAGDPSVSYAEFRKRIEARLDK